MWQPNLDTLHKFIIFFRDLPVPRLLLSSGILLLAFLYPGHNARQLLVLQPGTVKGVTIPPAPTVRYPSSDLTPPPPTSARAIVIQDVGSKTILYSRNPDQLIIPASTTKIMTALVALDTWTDLDTVVTVQNEDRAIGSTIELVRGEQITVQNLLYGLLVHSGNDAALALADNYPAPTEALGEGGSGGYAGFVAAMNEKAKALHLEHTVYKNPSGVEQYGHVTSARDLAVLAGVAMQNPLLSEIASTRSITITDLTGSHRHVLESTNELLGVLPGIRGLKTGWTTNAGECLVSYVERDSHAIITVVMDSSDRFGDTQSLVEWAFAHHQWIVPTL